MLREVKKPIKTQENWKDLKMKTKIYLDKLKFLTRI